MESGGEDLDNIFAEDESHENGDNSENRDPTVETTAGVRVAPPKRIIKNPRLKFNPERLCGKRGIPILMDHFKNVKFKGKGHEKEDLDMLLTRLEHWTHRLYPSMKFEDCLHHIEKLGKKRPVQTCLRKIRLDMPILDDDFVKDDEEDDVLRNGDPDPEPPAGDAFDRLIAESQDILNPTSLSTENMENNYIFSSPVPSENRGQVLGTSFGSNLTQEQKERMQRNRLLAAERRKAKLGTSLMNTSDTQSASDNMSSSQSTCANDDIFKQPDPMDNIQDKVLNDASIDEETNYFTEARDQNLSALNNNSENLGLDDLIDLVDEDETECDKNVTTDILESSNEVCGKLNLDEENLSGETGISFKETVPINISNVSPNMDSTVSITIGENVEMNKECGNAGEMLGLNP